MPTMATSSLEISNLLISNFPLLLSSLLTGLMACFGVWLGYKLTQKQAVRVNKIEAYANIKSNLPTHFANRPNEEIDRIFGKALILAEPELRNLLEYYRYIVIAYNESFKIHKEILKDNIQYDEYNLIVYDKFKQAEFFKEIKKDKKINKALMVIENLMKKELGESMVIDSNEINGASDYLKNIIKEIDSKRVVSDEAYSK